MNKAPLVYVCGHKNPDTDSCCSAICYANYLRTVNPGRTVQAITAGPVMEQTRYILNKFEVPLPDVVSDISPLARHIPSMKRQKLQDDAPLSSAFDEYQKTEQLDFACLGEDGTYTGMLQMNDLISAFLRPDNESILSVVKCTIKSLIETLNCEPLTKMPQADPLLEYKVVTPTMSMEAFKIVSADWTPQKWHQSIFVMGYNLETARFILEHKGGVIIFTRSTEQVTRHYEGQKQHTVIQRIESSNSLAGMQGFLPESTLIKDKLYFASHIKEGEETDPFYKLIKEIGAETVIMQTKFSVASTMLLIKQATPVKCLCSQDKVFQVKDDTPLRDVKERFLTHKKVHALAVVDKNGKYLNLLKRYDFDQLNLIDLVLVDHNELGQQPTGSQAIGLNVVEIVDHHKICIDDNQKVHKMTVKPVGCTCTIIHGLFKQKGITIDRKIGCLLMSAILCDTLILKSPTSTPTDQEALTSLQELTGIDYLALGAEIFGSVQGFNVDDKKKVLKQDYKIFEAKQGRYGVSQVEISTDAQLTDALLDELQKIIGAMRQEEGLFLICCLVTDVQKSSSILLTDGPSALGDIIGYNSWKGKSWCYDCPGIVSRKKQLMPHLISVLSLLG